MTKRFPSGKRKNQTGRFFEVTGHPGLSDAFSALAQKRSKGKVGLRVLRTPSDVRFALLRFFCRKFPPIEIDGIVPVDFFYGSGSSVAAKGTKRIFPLSPKPFPSRPCSPKAARSVCPSLKIFKKRPQGKRFSVGIVSIDFPPKRKSTRIPCPIGTCSRRKSCTSKSKLPKAINK